MIYKKRRRNRNYVNQSFKIKVRR